MPASCLTILEMRPVAAAAEDGDDPLAVQGADRLQDVFQGIAGVGVIHQKGHPPVIQYPFHPPRNLPMTRTVGLQLFQNLKQLAFVISVKNTNSGSH